MMENVKFVQNPQLLLQKKIDIQKEEKKLVTKNEENYIMTLCEGIKSPELKKAMQKLGEAIVVNKKSDG